MFMLKAVVGTGNPVNEYETKKFGQVNFQFEQVKITPTCPTEQSQNKLMSNPA